MNLSASEKRSFQDENKLSFQANDAIFTTAPVCSRLSFGFSYQKVVQR